MPINVKIKRLILHGFDELDARRFKDSLIEALHGRLTTGIDIEERSNKRIAAEIHYRKPSELARYCASHIARRLDSAVHANRDTPRNVSSDGSSPS